MLFVLQGQDTSGRKCIDVLGESQAAYISLLGQIARVIQLNQTRRFLTIVSEWIV
jgi:hypothetical protein